VADILQTLAAPMQAATATHAANPQYRMTSPLINITSNDLNNLKNKNPDNDKIDKPKAYLNYVFFDKQFNFVDDGSGVKQVDGEPGKLETLASGKVVAKKNGYVYVYTSNESRQDVLFDNFGVLDITGPVLEETHYYPFGLTMAGISSTAPLQIENRFKFNGIELNHKEFSDGSGLELYTAQFRGLDPQIGRWRQIDPKPDYAISPYAAMNLNPIRFNDFLGDTVIGDLKAKQEYVNTIDKNIDQGVSKVNKLLQKSLHATGNKLKSLNKRIARAQQNVKGFTDARNEFNTLESSTQNYNIVTGVTGLSINENGETVYDPSTGNVDVEVSASAPNSIGTLAHELKHAYQYETNEASLMYSGKGSGPLTDLHDELQAFRRGQLFGDNTSVNFTIPLLQKMYPADPVGPINVNTPYPGTNGTYGDAIKQQIILLEHADRPPVVIIKGWQSY
jgi:RHS repeat-associated protein